MLGNNTGGALEKIDRMEICFTGDRVLNFVLVWEVKYFLEVPVCLSFEDLLYIFMLGPR